MSTETTIKKTALNIACLPWNKQKELLEIIFNNLDDDSKQKWLLKVSHLIYPSSRWQKIDTWMEKQFNESLSPTPRKIASMALHYFKINRRMMPLMINIAQKVKKRLNMRERRAKKLFK